MDTGDAIRHLDLRRMTTPAERSAEPRAGTLRPAVTPGEMDYHREPPRCGRFRRLQPRPPPPRKFYTHPKSPSLRPAWRAFSREASACRPSRPSPHRPPPARKFYSRTKSPGRPFSARPRCPFEDAGVFRVLGFYKNSPRSDKACPRNREQPVSGHSQSSNPVPAHRIPPLGAAPATAIRSAAAQPRPARPAPPHRTFARTPAESAPPCPAPEPSRLPSRCRSGP